MVWPLLIGIAAATAGGGLATKYLVESIAKSPAMIGLSKGAAYAVPGAGLTYVGTKIQGEKLKYLKWASIISGLGLIGYGSYQFYKGAKEASEKIENLPPKPPEPDDSFPINITDPRGGNWSIFMPHDVDAQVSNPSKTEKKYCYVGLSMFNPVTGAEVQFPVEKHDLAPGQLKHVSWYMTGTPDDSGNTGRWRIVVSSWDVQPYAGCETAGICHRLGYDESYVNFTLTGI